MTSEETRLYVMVVDMGGDIRHFKIEISSKLMRRISGVQTGCPTPIDLVMSVPLPLRFMAEAAEKHMHALLAEHHVTGEWFAFNMKLPEHKAAFHAAAKAALDRQLGPDWAWSYADMKIVRSAMAATRSKERQNLLHAYRMAKGLPMW